MRGLPSEYTLVLIDGRRQSNVGQLYPNNFGGGQFAYLPPLDAIERIEVVRGRCPRCTARTRWAASSTSSPAATRTAGTAR
jgi:outer membrane receptor for ferrienterochelin and colicin